MTLEEQIATLNGLGIELNEGVTIDDLLLSWSREKYEERPFDLVLFMLGVEIEEEPWGRYFSDDAWSFDVECIEGTGSYIEIVQQFARITDRTADISNLKDHVDIDNGKAWLYYELEGVKHHYDVKVDNDWADPEVVSRIMEDLGRNGMEFYAIDNGQASIWYYLDQRAVRQLSRIANNRLNQ